MVLFWFVSLITFCKFILSEKIPIVSTIAGQRSYGIINGIGTQTQFYQPFDVSISSDEEYAVISDQSNNLIRKLTISTKEVINFIGAGVAGSGNGFGTNTFFYNPSGVCFSSDDSFLLINENTNNDNRYYNTSTIEVITFIGQLTAGSTNGYGTSALLNNPNGVSISSDNKFALISDTNNHQIRKLTISTQQVILFAGSNIYGYSNGYGTVATFNQPFGISISPDNKFALVADKINNQIRKILLSNALVSTIAGKNKGNYDGIGTFASFNQPVGVFISPDNSYALISDTNNHLIRRLTFSTLLVDTLAGQSSIAGYANGIGSNAKFNYPYSVAISKTGKFALVTDTGNNLIRLIELIDSPTQAPSISSIPTISPAPSSVPTIQHFPHNVKSIPHAGKWSCSDGTACVNLNDCTQEDAAYRTGNLCHEWPWYNGGYPLAPLNSLPESNRDIECHDGRYTTCAHWDITKYASDYNSFTVCQCNTFDPKFNHDVCEEWSCDGYSVRTSCDVGKYDCGSFIRFSDNLGYYEGCCWSVYDENGQYLGEASELKSVWWKHLECEAQQLELNKHGAHPDIYYLKNWKCISTLNNYESIQIYTCQDRNYQGYCEDYTSTIDSSTQFENSVCSCESYGSTNPGYYYCASYDCKNGGYYKHAPNLGFIALGLTVGALGALGLFMICFTNQCATNLSGRIIFGCFFFLFHCGIQIATVEGGGIAALIISEVIILGVFIIAVCIYYLNPSSNNIDNDKSSIQMTSPVPVQSSEKEFNPQIHQLPVAVNVPIEEDHRPNYNQYNGNHYQTIITKYDEVDPKSLYF